MRPVVKSSLSICTYIFLLFRSFVARLLFVNWVDPFTFAVRALEPGINRPLDLHILGTVHCELTSRVEITIGVLTHASGLEGHNFERKPSFPPVV